MTLRAVTILAAVLILICSPVFAFEDDSWVIQSAGGVACATAEIVPTVDTLKTGWTLSTGTDAYALVDELLAARSDVDYVYQSMASETYITLRVSLPGDCNVTAITVQARVASSASAVRVAYGTISFDNTNWQADQNFSTNTGYITFQEQANTYSSLAWITPAYCYVRFIPVHNADGNSYVISALSIVVNP